MSFITCEYAGRIGNIMFQTATTIGVAKHFGRRFLFPENPFGLEVLNNPGLIQNVWTERGDQMYQDIPDLPNLQLKGYFQKEQYFSPHKKYIIDVFNRYLSKGRPNKTMKGTCSIHVRRGDYTVYTDYFCYLTNENYYAKAISEMPKYTHFLVFSDDIAHAKTMFLGNNFEFISGGSPEDDMFLMSQCEHNIIANSSFSWFGAWLNLNPDKKVISPGHNLWFCGHNAHLHTNGLIPEGWKTIE